jgi:hypothetical protein
MTLLSLNRLIKGSSPFGVIAAKLRFAYGKTGEKRAFPQPFNYKRAF